MNWSRVVPGMVVGAFGLIVLMLLTARGATPAGEMDLEEFARIPVVADGRIKPIDTVARNSLLIISKKESFEDKDKHSQPAIRWLLDVLVSLNQAHGEQTARDHKVFRIDDDQLLSLLDLEHRPGSWRYALNEIWPKREALKKEIDRAREVDGKQRTVYDQNIIKLSTQIHLYQQLEEGREPLLFPVPGAEDEKWLSYASIEAAAANVARTQLRKEKDVKELSDKELYRRFVELSQHALATAFPAGEAWARILEAYRNKDARAFNEAVADFRKQQGQISASDVSKARFEVSFNQFDPFTLCAYFYVFVFVLCCASWLGFADVLNWSAFGLAALTFAVHTGGLIGRMYLQGRPPVTNLYSAAVFVGWGCVLLGLIFQWVYRNGLGNLLAAVAGAATVRLAVYLAVRQGDTLEMMQAVLDTNFWLATHVTCVSLGYSATAFAGLVGVAFIVLGLFTPYLDRDRFRVLGQMMYGVLCFATFFSFVGTVLGGIWADQSWGRFWGWDPKENGALLIVLMNALILHARWAGMVKQRGMAVLATAGNMIVGWSFFGTNQLGVGLHAYGFNDALARGLTMWWAAHLVLLAMGLVPSRYWRSFGRTKVEPARQPVPKVRGNRNKSPGLISP